MSIVLCMSQLIQIFDNAIQMELDIRLINVTD